MELLEQHRIFGGWMRRYRHDSTSCQCPMTFSVFLPATAAERPLPVLYWLSGLTCTDENFTTKAGAQRYAAEHDLILVAPDTSPRGAGVADADRYDLGMGAGFYVNATQQPWATHYRMYDYVTRELPALIAEQLPVDATRQSITGHSMGGHGALICALKNPGRYRSVSAFAPIAAPSQCQWGQDALSAYLGDDRNAWREWDSVELIKAHGCPLPLLVDQGEADDFLTSQLMPERLADACAQAGVALTLNRRPDYDHSYYFIASFIGEHIAYHARYLHAD